MKSIQLTSMGLKSISDQEALVTNGGSWLGKALKAAGKAILGPIGAVLTVIELVDSIPDIIDGFNEGRNSVPPAK